MQRGSKKNTELLSEEILKMGEVSPRFGQDRYGALTTMSYG
jgi:hypothetical protein